MYAIRDKAPVEQVSGRFVIPDVLYGRNLERQALFDAFERVCRGSSEIVLVLGWAGMGKSALIHELHKPVVTRRGFFAAGKFEQYHRQTPYFGLLQALQRLLSEILSKEESVQEAWRQKLLAALAPNTRLLIDVLPELGLIVGDQPPVEELPPAEAQNRFALVMTNFINLFASEEHPLVLVLDDMQWIDADSLQLLERLSAGSQSSYLLIVGAFRDNEVDENHPLMHTLGYLSRAGVKLETIPLQTLSRHDVGLLLHDTLDLPLTETSLLAEFLLQKTGGNPFFLVQLLHQLYKRELIYFDPQEHQWFWSIAAMDDIGVTQNVVQLLLSKLNELPEPTRSLLSTAACIGSRFTLGALALFAKQPIAKVVQLLKPALEEGLIVSDEDPYRLLSESSTGILTPALEQDLAALEFVFGHDNIQTAAYTLLSEELLAMSHAALGRQLLQSTEEEDLAERIFTIVDHLNAATHLLSADEQRRLAWLNVQAGKKAVDATAFQAAAKYFDAGIALLQGASWEESYALKFSLYFESARCLYLNGSFAQAEQLFEHLLAHIKSDVERASVYLVRMNLYLNTGKLAEVQATGRDGLALFGIDVPVNVTIEMNATSLAQVSDRLGGNEIASVALLPGTEDPEHLAVMNLFFLTATATYLVGDNNLWKWLVLHMGKYSLKHGNTPLASYAYCSLGVVVGQELCDYSAAYQWGQAGKYIADNTDNLASKCIAGVIYGCFIGHWPRPIAEIFDILEQAFADALHSGNLVYCAYARCTQASLAICAGWPLEKLSALSARSLQFVKQIQYDDIAQFFYLKDRWVAALRGETPSLSCMGTSEQEEAAFLAELQNRSALALHEFHVLKAHLHLLADEIVQAWEQISISETMLPVSSGLCLVAQHRVFHAIIAAARHESLLVAEQAENIAQIERDLETLRSWAREAPGNFAHRVLFVEAELAVLRGDELRAMSLYAEALERGLAEGFLHEAALTAERAGQFHTKHGRHREAHSYLIEAFRTYLRWGAIGKLASLRGYSAQENRLHERLSPSSLSLLPASFPATSFSNPSTSAQVDLSSLLKSILVISQEMGWDALLRRSIQTLLKHAGAERGFLLLSSAQGLCLEAGGVIDGNDISVHWYPSIPVQDSTVLCQAVVRDVERTRQLMRFDDVRLDPTYGNDPYITKHQPRSLLCMPLLHDGKLAGILYLEHRLTQGLFTEERLEVLQVLSSQIAISLTQVRYLQELQEQLAERDLALQEAANKLHLQEQQLQDFQQQLMQSEKMASLGTLLSGVAHEINNPSTFTLNGALNLQQRLKALQELLIEMAGEDADEEVRALLEAPFVPIFANLDSVLDGAERIAGIVGELRTFSHVTEKKSVHLTKYLQSTLTLVKAQFKEHITFVCDWQDDPELLCWPAQLNQVFMNMMVNACHAIHARHENDPTSPPGEVRIQTRIEGQYLAIRFSDNGIGITSGVQAKMFTPFFTTKGVGQGTGLGLSISQEIIEKHEGRIDVRSTPHHGTTFTIFLPLSS